MRGRRGASEVSPGPPAQLQSTCNIPLANKGMFDVNCSPTQEIHTTKIYIACFYILRKAIFVRRSRYAGNCTRFLRRGVALRLASIVLKGRRLLRFIAIVLFTNRCLLCVELNKKNKIKQL